MNTIKKYPRLDNNSFHDLHYFKDRVLILDKLNFKNWRKIIINSKLVITYECMFMCDIDVKYTSNNNL